MWAVRRRGQVLLTGLPGAGKSTALSALAADSARRLGSPLPIVVRLDQLNNRMATRTFEDALLDLASEDATQGERALVREVLADAIEAGQVQLLFDALDETGQERHELLRRLKQFVGALSADAEVVVATRDVAYADARILSFHELRLLPPRDFDRTVKAVLEKLAELRRVDETERESWVETRSQWVTGVLGRNDKLKETPLLAVLLALLAATRSDANLPLSRSEVMRQVVGALIEQWEIGKDQAAEIGALSGARARLALEQAYTAIASLLMRQQLPVVGDARTAVRHLLESQFDLPSAELTAIAEATVAFWDRAGFFVATEEREQILPRLRLFAEAGEAWRAQELEGTELEAWVATALRDDSWLESLRLAAEGSDAVTAATTQAALASGEPDLLLVAAGLQRITADRESAASLLEALIKLLTRDPDKRWDAAYSAARLPMDDASAERLAGVFEAELQPGQNITARALLALEHGHPDSAALFAVLDIEGPERPKPPESDDALTVWQFLGPDVVFDEVIRRAVHELLPGRPELAPRVVELSHRFVSGLTSMELDRLLFDHGHGELVTRSLKDSVRVPGLTGQQTALDQRIAFDRLLLTWLSEAAEPPDLEFRQKRRLGELVDFWTTLRMSTAPAFEPSGVYEAMPDKLEQVTPLFLTLTGLDSARVSAEARQLLKEIEGQDRSSDGPWDLLHMRGRKLPLRHWEGIEEPEAARKLLVELAGVGRWLSVRALEAFIYSKPSNQDQERLAQHMRTLRRPYNRELVARALLELSQDRAALVGSWLDDPDPALRRTAGMWVVRSGETPDWMVERLLDDPDDQVRREFVEEVEATELPTALLEKLRGADWEQRPWTCPNCETQNSAHTSGGCTRCHTAGGGAGNQAEKLFASLDEAAG